MSPAKTIILDWKGYLRFDARNEKGVSARFDASKENGGEGTALSPMETLLASLAACTRLRRFDNPKKEAPEGHWLLR